MFRLFVCYKPRAILQKKSSSSDTESNKPRKKKKSEVVSSESEEEAESPPKKKASNKKKEDESKRPVDPVEEDEAPAPKKKSANKKKEDAGNGDAKAGETQQNWFEMGYEAEKIVGATDVGGELVFLIRWKDNNKAQLVPSREARKHCPQLVIDFFEQKLTWQDEKK
jgi:cytoskeletal protein RodZ